MKYRKILITAALSTSLACATFESAAVECPTLYTTADFQEVRTLTLEARAAAELASSDGGAAPGNVTILIQRLDGAITGTPSEEIDGLDELIAFHVAHPRSPGQLFGGVNRILDRLHGASQMGAIAVASRGLDIPPGQRRVAYEKATTAFEALAAVWRPISECYMQPYLPTATEARWRTAELIETSARSAHIPEVAIDPSGNAVVVWQQTDGIRFSIWSNRYSPGRGWGTAELIETGTGDARHPQIAMDASGNAIAVWRQSDGTRYNVWASRYLAGSGWTAAQLIETGAGDTERLRVAVDTSGNAFAVWHQHDGVRNNIWSNRYTPAGGWGIPQPIETGPREAREPDIAVDASGNAIAVWLQSDGARYGAWANRYTNGSGWGTAELIETAVSGVLSQPHISMNGRGEAVALWRLVNAARTEISLRANSYTPGTGWGTPGLLETRPGEVREPHVTVDANGNAFAIWRQTDTTREDVWVNRLIAGGGWQTAERIETGAGDALSPQVAVDASGNAIAAWHQTDGTRANIWANRYTTGRGWATAELIENDNSGSAVAPQIAITPGGNAVVLWHQHERTGSRYNIWANRFD
jgi:hypothetical protein